MDPDHSFANAGALFVLVFVGSDPGPAFRHVLSGSWMRSNPETGDHLHVQKKLDRRATFPSVSSFLSSLTWC